MTIKKRNRYQQGLVKLERALSKLGLASRTEARVLIKDAKVKVNGRVCKDPSYLVQPEHAQIEISDQLQKTQKEIVIIFHKPKGCVTTKRDENGRKTVYDFLPEEFHRLHPVGRLDFATSGLLIFTNNTKLSSQLTNPQNQILRTYLVTVRGEVIDKSLKKIHEGIWDKDELLKAESVSVRKRSARETHLTIQLTEGKNREIRRLFLALGHEVIALKRIAFGEFELGELQSGEYKLFSA